MNIEPRNDLVVIQRIDDPLESKSAGGIIIPQVAQEKGIKGRVLAVGPGKWVEGVNGGLVRKPLDVKVGDLVLFNSKWSELAGSHYAEDTPIQFERVIHLVMEADIFCKLNAPNRDTKSN